MNTEICVLCVALIVVISQRMNEKQESKHVAEMWVLKREVKNELGERGNDIVSVGANCTPAAVSAPGGVDDNGVHDDVAE